MDFEAQTQSIWIVLGTLSGLGMAVAFVRTWAWYSKSGKEVIDLAVRFSCSFYIYINLISLQTIGKLFLYFLGTLGTVSFLVMAGTSIWWLIFFKVILDPIKSY